MLLFMSFDKRVYTFWAAPFYVLAETLREYHQAKASFEDVSAAPFLHVLHQLRFLLFINCLKTTLAYSLCDLYLFFVSIDKQNVE